MVEGGGDRPGNTPWSSRPNRACRAVGLCRVRPLPRRSVLALHEAASREGPANQRWYRVDLTPSVHVDRGCFFTETEYERRAARRGALCVFGAALLYSLGGLCIKVIPWGGMAINGGRNLIALLVIGAYLLLARHRLRLNRWILLGGLCVCGTNVLFSVANKMTTAANVIVLQFTAPIFVLLLGALFWRRRPGKMDVIACMVVLAGVLCFFVESLEAGDMAGNVLALLSGLSYAGVFLLKELPDSDPISSVFWGDVLSAVIGLPALLGEQALDPGPLFSLVVLGALQVGLAYILLTIGLRTTPPVAASLISGIEPVLNPILVAVFYHETIGPLSLAGAVIVVGAIVIYQIMKGKAQGQPEG